jgi:rod shape-determining protein MreD
MGEFSKRSVINKFLRVGPLLILFTSVLNEFDFNYLKFFSFNFTFILIFYWTLRKSESLGYGYIFIAGLINDVVTGFPIGISSFNYLLICGFSAYLRTITLRPSLIKDWLFFLLTILVVNSLSYSILHLFFSVNLNYFNLFQNIFFTFILYIVFANFFIIYQKNIFRETND